MGGSLRKAGQPEAALEAVQRARAEFLHLGDTRMAERALLAAGETSAAIGQASADPARDLEAVEALAGVAAAMAARQAYHYEAQALEALVPVLVRTGDHVEAQARLSRVVQIHTESRSPRTPELKAWLATLSG